MYFGASRKERNSFSPLIMKISGQLKRERDKGAERVREGFFFVERNCSAGAGVREKS